jgi:hypothetical protein
MALTIRLDFWRRDGPSVISFSAHAEVCVLQTRGCPLMDGGAHRNLRAVAIRSQYLMSRIGNKIGTEAGRGRHVRFGSALPSKADIRSALTHVRFGPIADIWQCNRRVAGIRIDGLLASLTLPDPFRPSRPVHCETVG